MQNTEYNIEMLSSILSPEASLEALIGIIDDMDLEVEDIKSI